MVVKEHRCWTSCNASRSGGLSLPDLGLVMQNGVQQRLVNIGFSVVIDEAQSAKLVHEETNTGSCRADHFSQRFLAKRNRYDRWIYLTKACRTCPLKDQCTTA